MGLMDDAKSKMGNTDELKARFNELKDKQNAGELDDKGRAELAKLREKLKK